MFYKVVCIFIILENLSLHDEEPHYLMVHSLVYIIITNKLLHVIYSNYIIYYIISLCNSVY